MVDEKPDGVRPGLISVCAEPKFLHAYSDPKKNEYFFSYTITINNNANCAVQLVSRHWIITDSNGDVQEVRGEGVVGQKPIIFPGSFFSYTSSVSIKTAIGIMEGSYFMRSSSINVGDSAHLKDFEVPIPAFSIHPPNSLH